MEWSMSNDANQNHVKQDHKQLALYGIDLSVR